MARRIPVINGHPDPSPDRFCAGLAGAYEAGGVPAGRSRPEGDHPGVLLLSGMRPVRSTIIGGVGQGSQAR